MIDALGIKGRKGGRRRAARDDEATIGAGIAEALLLRAIPIPHPAASPAPETIPATAMPAGASGSSPDTVIRTLDIQPIADAAPASPSIAHPIAGPGALTYQAPIAAADGTSIVRPFLITEDAVAFRPLPAQQAIESGAAIIHPLAAAAGEAPLMAASFGGGTSHSAPAISVTGTTAVTVDISHLSADAGSVVVEGKTTIALSSLFSVTASSSNPTYLVLSVLDRDEYSAAATGATGTISGNGVTASLSAATSSNDARTLGIVFTYDSANGRYYNSTYGYFDALTYTASASANDITDLAVYATSNAGVATRYANDTYALTLLDSAGYVATVTVATEAGFSGTVPSQATPSSIEAIAKSFVGDAWNMDGCWTLASTIAAEAGASLPVASTYVGTSGQAGGEWIVAYNGPVKASANWEAQLTAGEFVVFETTGGTGHIAFVESGSGYNALLIDNVTYESASGTILNSANDGSSSDVIISAAHSAAEELAGVSATSVVVYELDTPIVTALVSTATVALNSSEALTALFTAIDPAGKTLTEFQIYDTNSSDSLSVNGTNVSAHTAGTATETTSLSLVKLVTGATAGTDTIDVRAYNGTSWGDWDSITVTVSGSSTSTSSGSSAATITVNATAAQTATAGTAYSYTLASNTFVDSAGLAITTKAYQTSGVSAVSWLHYNATTETLSGTAPIGSSGTITIDIIATDSAGHTASDIFALTIGHGTASALTLVGVTSVSTEQLSLG